MAMQEPKPAEALAEEPLYVVDAGLFTEEDLEAVRVFLDDPVGVDDEGNLVGMSPESVLAVRVQLDARAAALK